MSIKKIQPQLISAYMAACKIEKNDELFKLLCINFISETMPDDYDALLDLKVHFKNDNEKSAILIKIDNSIESGNEDAINF